MRACLFRAESQAVKADRLIEFCRRQDGTELEVFSATQPDMDSITAGTWAFLFVAMRMRKEPFLWMEPDASPLHYGWLSCISAQYPGGIMSPHLTNKHDHASGICAYPEGMVDALPPMEFFQGPYHGHAWDLWVEENLQHIITRTKLIQHSYGVYDDDGFVVDRHRFPRDSGIIQDDAVIFHADKHQDLLADATT